MSKLAERVLARKFIRIRERNQITLPAEIISGLAIHSGDFLEIGRTDNGLIYLKPTVLVTVASPEAHSQESLADDDIAEGRYKTFNNAAELMDDIQDRHTRKRKKKNVEVAKTAQAAAR